MWIFGELLFRRHLSIKLLLLFVQFRLCFRRVLRHFYRRLYDRLRNLHHQRRHRRHCCRQCSAHRHRCFHHRLLLLCLLPVLPPPPPRNSRCRAAGISTVWQHNYKYHYPADCPSSSTNWRLWPASALLSAASSRRIPSPSGSRTSTLPCWKTHLSSSVINEPMGSQCHHLCNLQNHASF